MLRSVGYLFRRGSAWLKRRLTGSAPGREKAQTPIYANWIRQRMADRLQDYPPVNRANLFSLLTPVFDPPAGYLKVLGKSIFAQDHHDWEWVVVDNGCRHPDVLFLLDRFARDSRVKLVKAGSPQGIVGGMRLALEHAGGQYVCPVDHDDRLYPDALRVVAASLQAWDWPTLAYTDEDKLMPDGNSGLPFYKPDWDPILFMNCCYVAHLGVMNREIAFEVGAYSDPLVEGTPDGDAFCRFIGAGHTPVHIPEIVYSWRMHPQSTALLGIHAKPYVVASQKHALSCYLERQGLEKQISIRSNPLPGIAGTWRVCSHAVHLQEGKKLSCPVIVGPGGSPATRQAIADRLALCSSVKSIHALDTGPDSLREVLEFLENEPWVILLAPTCLPLTTDFVQEMIIADQVCAEAMMIGGIIIDNQSRVESAGLVWGFDGIAGSPLCGVEETDVLACAGALTFQRCVSAVDTRFCMVRTTELLESVEKQGVDFGDPMLPAWLGARARELGKRVLLTPYAKAQVIEAAMPRRISHETQERFLQKYAEFLKRDPYYPPFLGLTAKHAYQPVRPDLRANALNRLLSGLVGFQSNLGDLILSGDRYPSLLGPYPGAIGPVKIDNNAVPQAA